jgi:alkanesulfonate monooxygenase SsuD/methylene tetrahydromethanopterin reductase-like flavin-dependent oxidoreductase (luciferase family)
MKTACGSPRSTNGSAPSPGLFLAAVAQRTTKLRFGPLAYPLGLYHPLRLIEEICMLDVMSGGRLELGVGRGASPYEAAFFGIDAATAQERFDRRWRSCSRDWAPHVSIMPASSSP